MATVGFVGAGRMGAPMVERLLLGGCDDVVLYARSARTRQSMRSLGAIVVDSPAQVASRSAVAIVCVFDDSQLSEVMDGPDGIVSAAAPGLVVASHVTSRLATFARLSEALRANGARAVAAPVSGTPTDIANGRLTVLLSGADDDMDLCAEVMSSYGDPLLRVGSGAEALGIKLINNALYAAHTQLLVDALRIGSQLGIGHADLLKALGHGSGNSAAAARATAAGDVAEHVRRIGEFLRKDVDAFFDSATDQKIEVGALGPVLKNAWRAAT